MIRHRAARRAVCLALASATLLTACSQDEEPAATATSTTESASPTPSPTATRTLRPVVGERTSTAFPLGSGPLLGLGEVAAPNQEAIDQAVKAVGDWLDAHLDGLQRDGKGQFGAIAAKGLANAKQRRPVTTDLASPKAPVEAARYVMSVYHDGPPKYLTARVEVTHPDGSVATAGLVFTISQEGKPILTMFGPEPAAKAAS